MNCCSTFKNSILAVTLVMGFASLNAFAKAPIVIGDPSKGTPITSIQDGKNKVDVTTTGITIVDGDDDDADETSPAAATGVSGTIDTNHRGARGVVKVVASEKWEDTLVPIAFFLFLLTVILGARYISSRNEQRRLELLKLMVEKGQPVPENVVNQILTPQAVAEAPGEAQLYKRTRNAYGFTAAGIALVLWGLVGSTGSSAALVPGIVFLCLGIGGLAGLRTQQKPQTQEIPKA